METAESERFSLAPIVVVVGGVVSGGWAGFCCGLVGEVADGLEVVVGSGGERWEGGEGCLVGGFGVEVVVVFCWSASAVMMGWVELK